MKKYIGDNYKRLGKVAAEIKIQYGQEPDISDEWKRIIAIDDEVARHQEVDKLLDRMEQNSEQNGFFCADEKVDIGAGCGFLLDDKEIYYNFFDNLKVLYQEQNGKSSEMLIILQAIKKTEQEYFGGFGANKSKREDLTAIEIDDEAGEIVPSIKNHKGQNCSLCVERSAVAHNLWLLAGKTAYYVDVTSGQVFFEGSSSDFRNDGHAYNIVEDGGIFRLVDLAMMNACNYKGNPIEDMENGLPIIVGHSKTVNRPGIYANYSQYVKELGE